MFGFLPAPAPSIPASLVSSRMILPLPSSRGLATSQSFLSRTRGSPLSSQRLLSDPFLSSRRSVNLRMAKKEPVSPDQMWKNLLEGEFGSRGEIYVGLQFLLMFLVAFGPFFEESYQWLEQVSGIAVAGSGFALLYISTQDLGESLSPFPKATEDNVLQTDGVYSICRHPMYGGLILACIGLAMTTVSFSRMLFTIILLLILNQKADVEEGFLVQKHGESYKEYAKKVPKLVPNDLEKVKAFIEKLMKS
uniref:Protein-S-isoprenylcysteine O-methyltransferase n=1 Tax=Hanusia phi TaxID=3032 RepID=A0A7S0E531_9CRYP